MHTTSIICPTCAGVRRFTRNEVSVVPAPLRAGVPAENRHDTRTPLYGLILVVARAMESAGSGRAGGHQGA